jgi:hypothetical protein
MKKLIAVISFLAPTILAGGAFAAGMFGPPETLGKEDGNTVGLGYFSSTAKFQSDGFSDITAVQSQVYGEATASGWNLSEVGEGFLRVGGADFEGGGITSGSKFFVNAGMREQLYRKGNFCIGTVLQGSYFGNYDGSSTSGVVTTTLEVTGKWDVSLGLGFQYRPLAMIRVYAGPYVGYASFKSKRTATGGTPAESSVTYEGAQLFGGFAGARANVYKGLNVVGEIQAASDISGGVLLSYSF